MNYPKSTKRVKGIDMSNGIEVPMTVDNLFPLPILLPEGSLFFGLPSSFECKYRMTAK